MTDRLLSGPTRRQGPEPWPVELIDAMRQMAGERLSATQAARKLGKTRSAVLGKAGRMGIVFHATRWTGVDPYIGPPRPPPKPRPKPLPKPIIPSEAPESRGIDLMAINDSLCRWPYGDGPFTFCGQAVAEKSNYCLHHKSRAHTPSKPLAR